MGEFTIDSSLEYCNGPVGQFNDFLNIRGNHQNGNTGIFQLMNNLINIASGGGIDTACGFIKDHNLRRCGKRSCNDHFLLIAAGQAADQVFERYYFGSEFIYILLRYLILAAPVHIQLADFRRAEKRGSCIGRNGPDFKQTVIMAVFRNKIEAFL